MSSNCCTIRRHHEIIGSSLDTEFKWSVGQHTLGLLSVHLIVSLDKFNVVNLPMYLGFYFERLMALGTRGCLMDTTLSYRWNYNISQISQIYLIILLSRDLGLSWYNYNPLWQVHDFEFYSIHQFFRDHVRQMLLYKKAMIIFVCVISFMLLTIKYDVWNVEMMNNLYELMFKFY